MTIDVYGLNAEQQSLIERLLALPAPEYLAVPIAQLLDAGDLLARGIVEVRARGLCQFEFRLTTRARAQLRRPIVTCLPEPPS